MKIHRINLENAWRSCFLPIPPKNKIVLLGIRGGILPSLNTVWKSTWTVNPKKINHKHMRCVLGIWKFGSSDIFLAPGSTIPHLSQVLKSIEKEGKGTNQLELGYYRDFIKGEHLMGKLKGHQALRQTANRLIRRTVKGIPYGIRDRLFFSNPYDNLHCGWNEDPKQEGFSSSGCLIVAGQPHCPRIVDSPKNKGAWKVFHEKIYSVKQKKFNMLLLDYDAWNKVAVGKPKLIFGSTGEPVKVLQKKLKEKKLYKGSINGILDARTYRAWNQIDLQ